ncbi:hypothetical protein PRIPAC_73719 [Pristionchus pacificus]|uniref:Mitochondrial carrier protein n=1 Tax=Pristionchus pacificus TaxID=54126 RepID=A0A454XUB8_PRIPA|nr:hypothetical protein PRIPAC_73719 [Pristionchus pacificus]|eukprot:PDM83907.1 mitochondrial carrier protein [Pristionchus pacificus]
MKAIDGEKSHANGKELRHCDFVCGWGAGCIETCILYPSYKIIFRQQLHNLLTIEAWKQIRSEGIGKLYRGLLPPLIMRTSSRALMFGLYDEFCHKMKCSSESSLTLCHVKAAMLAGACEALLCPFERVQVLLQTSAYHETFRNTSEAVKAVRPHGFFEFYRGMSTVVFRNSLSNALFFTLREPCRELVLSSKARDEYSRSTLNSVIPFMADFAAGGVLGASISTIFFPVNVVKNRMQSQLGVPFENPVKIFSTVWRERNGSLKELFRGVQLNFTRSLLAWGITNSVYELLRKHLECS